MFRHTCGCPVDSAESGDSDICTCGATLRWALAPERPSAWRPEPRDLWTGRQILDEAEEFGG